MSSLTEMTKVPESKQDRRASQDSGAGGHKWPWIRKEKNVPSGGNSKPSSSCASFAKPMLVMSMAMWAP